MSEIKKHLQNQIETSNNFFWLKARHNLVSKKILGHSISNVVDIGAGVGGLGDELKKHYTLSYFFIEIDEKSQELLELKFGKDKNLLKNSKELKSSVCLAFLDVIEHVEDPGIFIDSYLKIFPNSYVIITVPAYQFLWSNWDILLGHFKRYSKNDIETLTKSLGIQKLEASYIFPELLLPAIFRKVVNSDKIDFPNLPSKLNGLLYKLSLIFHKLRKFIPFGLSVFYFGYYEDK